MSEPKRPDTVLRVTGNGLIVIDEMDGHWEPGRRFLDWSESEQYMDHLEAENTQLRTERGSWKGMYMLCNEREQELLKIKELAEKFTQAYDDSHCWIENGTEEVSDHLDDLTAVLTQREGGDDDR